MKCPSGSGWKAFIKRGQGGGGIGWSSACDAGGVTAVAIHPCLFSGNRWSVKVVSDVPAKLREC